MSNRFKAVGLFCWVVWGEFALSCHRKRQTIPGPERGPREGRTFFDSLTV